MSKEFNYTHEELVKMIDKIYNTESGKKFISHLIRSFFPVSKAQFLWDDPKDVSKLKCCITNHPLMSKATTFSKAVNNTKTAEDIKLMAKAVLAETEEEKQEALKKRKENFDQTYEGKLLAVYSEESDKYFANPTFEAFQDWFFTKMLSGDSHINWIVKSQRKNQALEYAKKKNINITPREESALNKIVNKPAKTNLEDNQALRGLMEKFKTEQND